MERLNGRTYVAILGALGVERLLEVRRSAANLTTARQGDVAAPHTFPLMVVVNCALFVVPALTRYRRARPPLVIRSAALTTLLLSAGLRGWVLRTLGESWNVRAHVPHDLRPSRRGPYQWVRHPNYVAVALEFAAVPTLGGAYRQAIGLSTINGLVLWHRIREEERLLHAIPEYRRVFAGVPRFVPSVRRSQSG